MKFSSAKPTKHLELSTCMYDVLSDIHSDLHLMAIENADQLQDSHIFLRLK